MTPLELRIAPTKPKSNVSHLFSPVLLIDFGMSPGILRPQKRSCKFMQIYAQVIYAEHCRAEPMSDPKSIQSPWAIWTGSSNEETRLLDKKGYMVCSRERQGLMTIVMFALIELVHGEVGLSGIGCLALEHHNNNNMYIYIIYDQHQYQYLC